jgi:hypothetical protein
MSYTDRVISLRAELKEELRDKILMTEDQLDGTYCEEGDEVWDKFYELPQATYWNKHGIGNTVYIFALEGTMFKAWDNEAGDVVEIDMDFVSLDTLAEFLDFSCE